MFKEYSDILNNPKDKELKENSYIYTYDINYKVREHLDYDFNNKEYYLIDKTGLKYYLIRQTSLKLSEIITDALFKDNLYNVRININELLRYNDKLEDKLIDNNRVNFYKTILLFDYISNSKKIEIYNNLKNKNIYSLFYDDLRKMKDKSYDLIKENLFKVSDNNDIDKKLSDKYNIKIYNYQDKKYIMLIRGMNRFREKSFNRRNCYSLISNENNNAFGIGSDILFYYGFNSFNNDHILSVSEQDSYSADLKDNSTTNFVNRIMTDKEIVGSSSWYSEIDIINELDEDGNYIAKRPDYLVVYDDIEERHIEEAKRLNIPIVLIKTYFLDLSKNHENLLIPQKYISNSLEEKEFSKLNR